MPKLLSRHYAKILYAITHELKPAELDQAMQNFAALLRRQRAVKKLPLIIAEFSEYADEKAGAHRLEVTSARPLAPELLQKIASAFSPKAKATAVVNPDLIGGVVVRTRQAILDASLQTRVVQLRQKLAGKRH